LKSLPFSAEDLGLDQPCRECGRISEAKNKEGGLAAEAPVLDTERVGNEEGALCVAGFVYCGVRCSWQLC
jgi:hypothetical protein